MTRATDLSDLTGMLLIAMPGMTDSRFAKSVVYLCAHSDEGAMGLIINKPTPELNLRSMLDQLSLPISDNIREVPIYFGGPVEHVRGFVLHSPDFTSDMSTLQVNAAFSMTGTLDVLEEFGQGRGPFQAILALGYAGWGPGQLESEIGQNGWLTCPASTKLVFETPDAAKWEAALQTLGIEALTLSASAGRA